MEMARERAPRARLRAFMFTVGGVCVGLQLDLVALLVVFSLRCCRSARIECLWR